MIINHNMSAINANRQMATNQANTAKSTEKLSSGLRINRAGDDAAGLAISEKMRAQISGLNQASSNAQDGISMIQTAEGALNETHSILQRMRELSVQSSNDTNTTDDRNEIQKEINQLTSEINRIGNTTEYNTQKVLKGGEGVTGKITVETTPGTDAGTIDAVAGKAVAQAQANLTEGEYSSLSGASATFKVGEKTFTLALSDIQALKGKSETDAADYIAKSAADGGDKLEDVAKVSFVDGYLTVEAKTPGDKSGVTIKVTDGTNSGDPLDVASKLLGVTGEVTGEGKAAGVKPAEAGQATLTLDKNLTAGEKIEINGKAYTAVAKGETAGTDEFVVGDTIKDTATELARVINADSSSAGTATAADTGITLVQKVASATVEPFKAEVKGADGADKFNVTLQIGANKGQTLNIEIGDMRAGALGISGALGAAAEEAGASFVAIADENELTDKSGTGAEYALDISTSEKATSAIEVIDKAITKVSSERSKIGAYQNRLEHTINNLGTSSENLTSAESRIRDVDMAEEMMEFTKNNVLSQASQAMLAQAKALPNQVLSLLQ